MTETRPRVAFLVNGAEDSAASERAGAFAARLSQEFDIALLHRAGGRLAGCATMLGELRRLRPATCVVFDLAAVGVLAADAFRRMSGTPFLVDTGDDIVALGQALGRGPLRMAATRWLERLAFRGAAGMVTRGSAHAEALVARGLSATFVPDGVAVARFEPSPAECPRPPGQNEPLRLGIVGSSVWEPRRGICYGLELVEALALLRDGCPQPVRGTLIGAGSGLPHLEKRARELGVSDLMEFAGRVPYEDLPRRLHGFHLCLSTQTDDAVGRVRTTGKLPLYLAAGRFVLASRVGEAARVLPPEMLIDYAGEHDPAYPAKLAERIRSLLAAGTDFVCRPECTALARSHFEYDRLAPRIAAAVRQALRSVAPSAPRAKSSGVVADV